MGRLSTLLSCALVVVVFDALFGRIGRSLSAWRREARRVIGYWSLARDRAIDGLAADASRVFAEGESGGVVVVRLRPSTGRRCGA